MGLHRILAELTLSAILTMMLALPHFCFKSFNAFAQARFYFGETQSKTKVFCCPYTASWASFKHCFKMQRKDG